MQRHARLLGCLLLIALPGLLGMGMTGGQESIQPTVDFRASVLDKDGTKIELSRVNIGGRVQLEGDLGRGNLRIPFENIAHIEFENDSRDRTMARVHLRQGEDVSLKVRNSLTFNGQTPVGLYDVRVRDLQRLEFTK